MYLPRVILFLLAMLAAPAAAVAQCSTGNLPDCPSPPFNAVTTNTLSVHGALTPSSTAGIIGTSTNDSPCATCFGYVPADAVATGVNVTGSTDNCTSMSLPAGDWDVYGNVFFQPASGTAIQAVIVAISLISGSLPLGNTQGETIIAGTNAPDITAQSGTGTTHQKFATTTTVYLVAQGLFSISTLSMSCTLSARRIR